MSAETGQARHVVITGGIGALGKALTRTAESAGYVVTSIDRIPAVDRKNHIGGIDLSDMPSVKAAMELAVGRHGGIFGLFNVSGAFQWRTIMEATSDLWLQLFRDNCLSTLGACQAAAPYMKSGGVIVNISAAAAMHADVGMAAYSASKAAVLRLSEALGKELHGQGIKVQCILPTTLDTPRNRSEMPDADWSQWENLDDLSQQILNLAANPSEMPGISERG
ncbi:SDR family NAD(P)-dependent oxidoreductase [Pseudoxanthomonas putridarboris]|uniref:SDR family NAD(P)-dependent oxidoreductase n=1 Tax=Pseudoxanthomonas putridarboris TaxID=752605 RepID=A0ABU9IWC9_9GAMM